MTLKKRFQFRRLVFGLTPSHTVLSTVIQNYLSQHQKEDADVSQLLKDSLYVDDFAGVVDNDQEAIEIYNKSQGIMEKGGIRLRKWNSDSKVLKDKIKEDTLYVHHKRTQVLITKVTKRSTP